MGKDVAGQMSNPNKLILWWVKQGSLRKSPIAYRNFLFLLAPVVMVALLIPPGAWAEMKKWSDEAELSYVDTGGNTEVSTLSMNNTLKYILNPWH